jgi:hypothetical protein
MFLKYSLALSHQSIYMKKNYFLLPITICMLVLAVGCNNSGSNENKEQADTTVHAADTIKSDPSKFSDPH